MTILIIVLTSIVLIVCSFLLYKVNKRRNLSRPLQLSVLALLSVTFFLTLISLIVTFITVGYSAEILYKKQKAIWILEHQYKERFHVMVRARSGVWGSRIITYSASPVDKPYIKLYWEDYPSQVPKMPSYYEQYWSHELTNDTVLQGFMNKIEVHPTLKIQTMINEKKPPESSTATTYLTEPSSLLLDITITSNTTLSLDNVEHYQVICYELVDHLRKRGYTIYSFNLIFTNKKLNLVDTQNIQNPESILLYP